MNSRKSKILATVSAAAVCFAVSPQAFAQEEEGTSPDALRMSGVVVTAQKRAESLSDVPISITALGEEELARQGAQSIDDVARVTPGLVMVQTGRGYGNAPIMRGIASLTGAPTVGVYINDTPVQMSASSFTGTPSPRLFDVERVEVLRGPQGTLYGSSSMGGTIRYVTASPSYQDYSGKIRTEIADTDGGDMSYEVAGAFGGPIAKDKLALRVAALYREDGGFVDRVDRTTGDLVSENVDDSSVFSMNTTLAWQVTDNLEIKPALFFQQTDRDDMPNFMPSVGEYKQYNTSEQPSYDRFYIPSLTVNYDIGDMTLTSVSSLMDKSEKQTMDYSTLQSNIVFGMDYIPGLGDYISTSNSKVTQKNFSQELRLTSADEGRFTWIVGGFYEKSENDFTQFVQDTSLEPLLVALAGVTVEQATGIPMLDGSGVYAGNTQTDTEQVAAFGEASYKITPALKATLGLRVSRSTVDFSRYTEGPLNGGTQFISGSQSDTPVTPKFGLSYDLADGGLLYATAQRGFRGGGVNPPVPETSCAADLAVYGGTPPADYDSDSLWSYEVGVKEEFFANRLAVNASAYVIDWSDIQQPVSLPNCGFGYTDNLGSARSQGLELEAQAYLFKGLTVGARVGYTDAHLSGDVLAPLNADTGTQAIIASDGDPIVGIPEWTIALNGEYSFPIGANLDAYVRGDYQWLGSYYRTQSEGKVGYNQYIYEADDYDQLSLRAGVMVGEDWDVSLFVNNLTNNDTVIGASTALSPTTGTLRTTTLRPRTIGITIGKQF